MDAAGLEAAPATTRKWQFGLSLLFFAMAITSKTATVTLPIVLVLCLWWRRRPLRWRQVMPLMPFFLISAAAAAWTIWEQKFHSGAIGAEWLQTGPQRFATAGHILWFYLGKIIWPQPLIFIYPRWTIDTSNPLTFLPASTAAIALFVLWWKRNGVLRPAFFGLAYFVISLFPVLDFFDVYYFRYSFVSNHLQYLASIGPIALFAAALTILLERYRKKTLWLQPVVSGVLVGAFALLSSVEVPNYGDAERLWRRTIGKIPRAGWLTIISACSWKTEATAGKPLLITTKLYESIRRTATHSQISAWPN